MATVIFIVLLICCFMKPFKRFHKTIVDCTLLTGAIVIIGALGYQSVLSKTPEDLELADQRIQSIQMQIDESIKDFRDLSDEDDVVQKAETFLKNHNALSEELEKAKEYKVEVEESLNPDNFWFHTIPKILLDFGITEKIIEVAK